MKIGQSTSEDYRTMLECYLLPYFGVRKIETISRMDIEQFRADMSGEALPDAIVKARDAKREEIQRRNPDARLKPLDPGPRTTNKCLGILVSIFNYACAHRLQNYNPATRIEKLPKQRDDESVVIEENILNPEELRATLAQAEDPYRIPIAIGIYCGPRIAEIVGLKWTDIDWNRHTAEIRRQQRGGRFWTPKSAAGRRTIELPGPLVAMLRAYRLRVQNAATNPHDLVCPSVRANRCMEVRFCSAGYIRR